MPKGSGGGGNGGRSGGGGSPAPGSDESIALERTLYRQSQDAFFKEKNYEKAGQLERQYKALHEVNEKAKLDQAVAKAGPLRITGTKQGSSVRDEGPSGKQMTNDQIARNAAKLKAASKHLKTKGWSDDSTPYNPYG